MHAPQEIWQDQCAATIDILHRFGHTAAFDYLVGEKLLRFTTAAATRPEFAQQLPKFLSEIRGIFPPVGIDADLHRVEDLLLEQVRADSLDDDLPSCASADLAAFRQVADLLRAPALGTA
ncbi:hypothetical protein JSE7799_01475 [Jannaschia seosinensis]|uniref:Uncharacterized protein n=2 Tax=Jannaschia seosinensis TaxID=313367 RepID=A0A0M7BBP8_9RHOB|nr:hypothetical protein JSE7799_01475 [Jannaschia seosinensis]